MSSCETITLQFKMYVAGRAIYTGTLLSCFPCYLGYLVLNAGGPGRETALCGALSEIILLIIPSG